MRPTQQATYDIIVDVDANNEIERGVSTIDDFILSVVQERALH